jgi:hypothetical protein
MSQIHPIKISGEIRNLVFSVRREAQLLASSPAFTSQSNPDVVPPNWVLILNLNQYWTPANVFRCQVLDMHVESSAIDAVPSNNF